MSEPEIPKDEHPFWFREPRTPQGCTLELKATRIVHSERSEHQAIVIFETEDHGRVFTLDGLVMVTERDEYMYHEMLVHVPMLTHPEPRSVLVIGGGDGGSIREVVRHASVEKAVLVEIDRAVVDAARRFLPFTSSGLDDPRVEISIGEGHAHVKDNPGAYDVVIIDSTDPTYGAGGLLFTAEFYKDCRLALRQGGVLSAETENPFYDPGWVQMAWRRMRRAFDDVRLYLGYVPVYPGALWTYGLATTGPDPQGDFRATDAARLSRDLRYYNPDVHASAFALPNFVKEVLEKAGD
jgi:spermidine synthase